MKHPLADSLKKAYISALNKAVSETGLPEQHFPKQCPYAIEQMMDKDFYPE
ncbi:DUF29 family protein [Candidatus Venteria ishoeyi]|uniref:DUF29 family protein n=1 Tax=Candidatus Venteria ishoeyi TaxID=1899563 RepID=UPI00387E9575